MTAVGDYLRTLIHAFGAGWNRFWFTPADVSTLGAVRLGTGMVLAYWLATFTPDLVPYFGPNGLAPQATLGNLETPARNGSLPQVIAQQVRESLPRPHRWSFLNLLHTPNELRAGHAAALAIALLFAVGLFTRVTSVLALVVLLSYLHRGPVVTAQVEPILAFVVFYLCLGPAGRAWSLDRWLAQRRRSAVAGRTGGETSAAANVSLRLIQVHLAVVYALMAIGKLSSPVWWEGLAVWLLIARSESRLIDLTWLHAYPYLISLWTYLVVLWQGAFPILVWHRLARPLLLVINAIMWASLAPVTGMLDFALLMVIASLAFVPQVRLAALTRPAFAAGRTE